MKIRTIARLSKQNEDYHFVENWPGADGAVPIYHADTIHAFNRIVGYARFINSTVGTVLYRGQSKLYSSLVPSGARPKATAVSEDIFDKVCEDKELSKFFNTNQNEIVGWKIYRGMLVESVLQHYGAHTYCMDFVDNHWCALWFGLYTFENNHYNIRTDSGNLYVFLYVADTTGPCVRGMYIGEDTYTVDLRKALPSTFQRPASQHGWIVRKKERAPCDLNDRLCGIIEVGVAEAKKWIGNGALLSEENFFPPFLIDEGYKVLLYHQCRAGVYLHRTKNYSCVFPQNTVCNYHYSEMYYISDRKRKFFPIRKLPFKLDSRASIIEAIFLSC